MLKNFVLILFCIFHVKGDLIQIEVEANRHNICPKPKLYRTDLSGLTADNSDEKLYCIPYEDNPSFYKAPEILRLKIKYNFDESFELPSEEDIGGIYTLDENFDTKNTDCTSQKKLEDLDWYFLINLL